jgi:hypothetical protein
MQKLYDILCQIQRGDHADNFGWTVPVKLD